MSFIKVNFFFILVLLLFFLTQLFSSEIFIATEV